MLHACDLIPKHQHDGRDRPAFGADDLWLLSAVLIWGGNAVASKFLLLVLSPVTVFYVRMLGVALVLGVPMIFLHRLSRRDPRVPWGVLIAGGLFMAGQNAAFFWGLQLTTASESALLSNTAPLWTALIVAGCGLESFRRRNWLGVLLALAGVWLVIFGAPRLAAGYAPAPALGGFLSLVSAVFFALYLVATKRAVETWGALPVLAVGYAIGAAITIPTALPSLPRVPWETLRVFDWGMLGYSVLLAGAYGYLVYYWVIGRTSAVRAALYQYLVPVIAAIAARFLLGEALHPLQYLGFFVTLAGVYLARPATPLVNDKS
jgi:drug/metabolite transporter (DMT)-like permease